VKTSDGATQPIVLTIGAKLKSNNSGTVVYTSPACTGACTELSSGWTTASPWPPLATSSRRRAVDSAPGTP
jgi:hypothetical protein